MKIIVLSCFPISASSFKEKQITSQEAFQSIQWMLHHLLKVSQWRELQNRSVSAWAHSPAAQGQFTHPFPSSTENSTTAWLCHCQGTNSEQGTAHTTCQTHIECKAGAHTHSRVGKARSLK